MGEVDQLVAGEPQLVLVEEILEVHLTAVQAIAVRLELGRAASPADELGVAVRGARAEHHTPRMPREWTAIWIERSNEASAAAPSHSSASAGLSIMVVDLSTGKHQGAGGEVNLVMADHP